MRYLDKDGSWGWGTWTQKHKVDLFEFLQGISTRPWNVLRSIRGMVGEYHSHAFNSLATEAQERAVEMKLPTLANAMSRFRLTGAGRLWGIEYDGVFYIVWWDPNHTVYPVSKNNT